MLELHYYPSNASQAPHILLHEIGVPFNKVLVDRAVQAHKSPAYLALNPNGLIPVLRDGDLVLYETAAICLHLVDTHAAAELAPPVGTAARAEFYKWLIWLTNTLQAMLIHYFYPDRMVEAGNADGAAQVRALALMQIGPMLDQLDAHLARHRQPWLLGAQYGAVDAYAFMLCRWTRGFTGAAGSPKAPARSRPHLGPYLQRMLARPAVQRVLGDEGLSAPWV